MRRKMVASFMAIVLCALMVLPQVGLAVRDATVDPGTVIEPSVESNAQQTPEVQESEDQGSSVPAADAEEGPSDTPAPTEQGGRSTDAVEGGETGEDASVPEQGEISDDSAAQGAEQGEDTPEDVPNDSQTTDVPATDAPPKSPATDQEPVAEEAPEDGEQPAEEAGIGIYTLSDVDEIIGSGISLASLQELMPASIASGKSVPMECFKFELSKLTGYGTKTYPDYSSLVSNNDGYKVGPWPGNASGDVTDAMFPEIENLSFDAVVLNGTIIESIGVVTVTVLGENGLPDEKDYVWFSPTGSGVSADAMVLPEDVTDTHLFAVRYVYATYNMKYEVYLDAQDISKDWLDIVFGAGRTETTKDGMASVSVSVPAGYTGSVYVCDTEGLTTEIFPVDMPGYGNHPLGQELAYKQGPVGAVIDDTRGPGFYSATGTYAVGSASERVSADQTVRVVLNKKTEYIFHPEFWIGTENGKHLADDVWRTELVFGNGKSADEYGMHAFPNKSGGYDLVWQFTTTLDGNGSGWLLESLEVNGIGLRMPYMEYNGVGQTKTEETALPSGGSMYITAKQVDNTNTCAYYLTVTGAKQGLAITGGSLRAANEANELVLEDSTGTEVQFFFCDSEGHGGKWVPAAQSQPVSASKDGNEFHYNGGDPDHNYTNVRFKLKSGHEWSYGHAGAANVAFTDQEGTTLPWGIDAENTVYPGTDGWNYLRLGTRDGYYSKAPKIGRLRITAKPVRYIIQYLDGSGAAINEGVAFGESGIEGMPGFVDGKLIQGDWGHKNTDTLDGNRGNYYSTAERTGNYFDAHISNTVSIHGSVPYDTAASRPAQFQGWVVTDAEGNALNERGERTPDQGQYLTCQPGSALSIDEVTACGKLFDDVERLYVVYLTAQWQARAPSYTYYVTCNETTLDGTKKTRIQIEGLGDRFDSGDVEAGKKANENYRTDDWYLFRRDSFFRLDGGQKLRGLNVAFDTKNVQMKQLMAERFAWYKYDAGKNSVGNPGQFLWSEVPNGGEVDVWLISNLGTLNVTKKVDSTKEAELNKLFPFTVIFTLPQDDPGTAGGEDTYFGDGDTHRALYTVNGLEGEQTLELENIGENQYTGTLELKNGQTASFILPGNTAYSITENVDAGYYEIVESGESGVIQAASAPSTAEFSNTPSGIVAEKTQVETADAAGLDVISTPSNFITVGSGDYVKYSIKVTNRDEKRSMTVTVTDQIPNAEGDDGSRVKLSVNKDSVSAPGEYTPRSGTAGTVRWEEVTIEPGGTEEFSFTVTAPVAYNLNTYINKADVEYEYDDGSDGHLTTNATSLVLEKDWLRIGKVLPSSNRGDAGDRDFAFHITLADSTESVSYPYIGLVAESYEGQDITAPENGTLTFTNGTAEVKLKEGQAIALYGVPENTAYTVAEEPMKGFRTSVVKQSTREETEGSDTSGVISTKASDWLIFKNTPVGVRLSKSQHVIRTDDAGQNVTVTPGDRIEYTITVQNIDQEMPARNATVTDTVPAGLTVDTVFNGGSQTGNSITWEIPELEPGGEETVCFTAAVPEDAADESFTNMASAIMTGTEEAFSNSVTAVLQTGTLAITKTVEGGPEPNSDIFSFVVELAHSADGAPLTGRYPYASDDASISGTVASGETITLKKGQTVTISGLSIDTHWTATETGPLEQDDHGYEGQAPKSGTLAAREPDGSAVFSNMWYGLYSLTYDGNGNTAGTPPKDGSRYREHEAATLQQPAPDFQRENAVFLGWSEKEIDTPLRSWWAVVAAQVAEEVEFLNSDVTVFAVWGADADGDGIPDYDESAGPVSTPEPSDTPGPSDTPEPGDTPEPSDAPGPGVSPEPESTLPPGVTSGPYFTPEPGAGNDTGSEADDSGVPDTGDSTRIGVWGAVLTACVIGLAAAWVLLCRCRSK